MPRCGRAQSDAAGETPFSVRAHADGEQLSAMHSPDTLFVWLPLIGALLAAGCLWGAMHANRKRRLIDGLPTCKTTGVFVGLVEVKGTAEAAEPLLSHLAEARCVYFSWTIEESWSRLVTETYTDSKGKTQTRVRRESGWTTVADGGRLTPFYLRDECGVLLVRPEGAKIEPQEIFAKTCGRGDPLYYGKGPADAVNHSDHQRRFREVAVALHTPIYVIGRARERSDIVAAEIAQDTSAPLFLISTRTEQAISAGHAWSYWLWLVLGLIVCSAGVGFGILARGSSRGQEWIPFALGAGAFLPLVLLAWAWMAYNSLVDLHHRVASAWSQVEVQLKRRFDLIPRLVAIVQGLQTHERAVQTSLAALRTQAAATPPGMPGAEFSAVGGTLLALAESYPALTASPLFLDLQKQLMETEERIALARGYYNEIATHFNTRLEIVPDRFVGAVARLRPRALMAANDFERATVQIALAD